MNVKFFKKAGASHICAEAPAEVFYFFFFPPWIKSISQEEMVTVTRE